MSRLLAHAFALLAALLVLTPAGAQLRVEITGVGSNKFPVSLAAFARSGEIPQPVDEIIRDDLKRSGRFRMIDAGPRPARELPCGGTMAAKILDFLRSFGCSRRPLPPDFWVRWGPSCETFPRRKG